MKKRIQLARTGVFGQAGTPVTKKDLEEIVETFSGDSPITLGHQLADYGPAFGQVTSVSLNEENGQPVLEGDIEIHQLLADAVEEGFYKKWSIGAPKRASDGKRYLHHLAFLGAVPPKVPGLKELAVNLADCPTEAIFNFGDLEDQASFLARMGQEREHLKWRLEDVKAIIDRIAGWGLEMAVSGSVPTEFKDQVQALSDILTKNSPDPEKDALKAQLASAQKASRDSLLSGLQASISGKVPAASLPLVMALADRLDLEEEFELADGEETIKLKGAALLKKIFESLPLPVKPGAHQFTDEPESIIDMTGLMRRI